MGLATVAVRIRPPSKPPQTHGARGVAADVRARRHRSLRSDARPTHHVSFSCRDRERRSTPPITVNTDTHTHSHIHYVFIYLEHVVLRDTVVITKRDELFHSRVQHGYHQIGTECLQHRSDSRYHSSFVQKW